MKKYTLDHISILTARDKKSLSQKALKACEEVGELAKVVLPFENAHATNHRFVDRKAILEECADTYLVVQSIAFELGFSYDEFEEMVKAKAKVWDELQHGEEAYQNELPFEIHITVRTDDIDMFVEVCKLMEVKPIVIHMDDEDNPDLKDVMTSSSYVGNNRDAYNEMLYISNYLRDNGMDVIREKIESVPWHPAAPTNKNPKIKMPENCYFECHFAVRCSENFMPRLRKLSKKLDCHTSQNIFKKHNDGTYVIMMTHRNNNTVSEDFKETINSIEAELTRNGFDLEKTIIEFTVYDTLVSHDTDWLTKD